MASLKPDISLDQYEEAARAAKAHLDSSFDFFMKIIQSKSNKRECIFKAQRTLGKASKIIFALAFKSEDDEAAAAAAEEEEELDRSNRSSKKRQRTANRISMFSNASALTLGEPYESEPECEAMAVQASEQAPSTVFEPPQRAGCSSHDHDSSSESRSKDSGFASKSSGSKQLVARRLVKRAKASSSAKYRSAPEIKPAPADELAAAEAAESEPVSVVSHSGGGGGGVADMSKETIDALFEKSRSIFGFTNHLMLHLFDHSELINCRNVYGRAQGWSASTKSGPKTVIRDALDEVRINMIRQVIRERAGPNKRLWQKCVDAMNKKISEIKHTNARNQQHKKFVQASPEKMGDRRVLYPKMADQLVPSLLYEENNISYNDMNQIFVQSKSMVNFAKNAMLYMFDESELSQCHSVHGQTRLSSDLQTRQGLDRAKIDFIRQMIEENALPSKTLWNECINTMNGELRKMRKRV